MVRGGRLVFFLLGVATGAAVAGFWRRRQNRRVRQIFRTKVKKDMLEKYVRHHRGVWPEVEEGLRQNGVRLLSIHQQSDGGNELCMFVEHDPDVDMGRDLGPGSSYRAADRVKEWEECMCSHFEDGTWHKVLSLHISCERVQPRSTAKMTQLYTLDDHTSTNSLPPLYAQD